MKAKLIYRDLERRRRDISGKEGRKYLPRIYSPFTQKINLDMSKKEFELIGRYITSCNTLEFHLNIGIEMLVEFMLEENKDINFNKTIDIFQRLPIINRYDLLKFLFLTTQNLTEVSLENELSRLASIKSYYESEHHPIRNYMAHNPYLQQDNISFLLSSKRMKGDNNKMRIIKIEESFKNLIDLVKGFNDLLSDVQSKINSEPIRDLN